MDSVAHNLPEQPASQLPRTPGIYRILNTVNRHCYIGSTISLYARKRAHLKLLRRGTHHNIHLQRAFNTYGEAAFEFQILEHVNDTSLLLEREQIFMDTLKPEYNLRKIAAGSNLGIHWSEEVCRKMSETRKGRPGTPHTEETKHKLGELKKGIAPMHATNAAALANRGKPAWNRGITHTPEARAKLSTSHIGKSGTFAGRHHSEEAKAKMGKACKDKPWSPARRAAEERRKSQRNHSPSLFDEEDTA